MKKLSFCFRCRNFKRHPQDRCTQCGLAPTTDREKAQSIVLSQSYALGEDFVWKEEAQLRAISDDIRSGRPYPYDEAELDRMVAAGRLIDRMGPAGWWREYLKTFWPGIIVVLGAIYLAWCR